MTSTQQQYLVNWRDAFVNYVRRLVSLTDVMKSMDITTENDKKNLELFKTFLHSKDVQDVMQDLSNTKVKRSTLDKIEKLDKDIVDFAIEHMSVSQFSRQFLKQVSYCQIERTKQAEINQLNDLKIPISEE